MLWVIFILLVACVTYLSFQNGEDAKAFGRELIVQAAQMQNSGGELTQKDLDAFTYEIRQTGRIVIFVLIGIVGTITIHVSCKKDNWLIQTALTAVVLVGIAYLTEKLKIFIPSRHYSYEEMLISISAVIVGLAFVSVITLAYKVIKSVLRFLTAGHT